MLAVDLQRDNHLELLDQHLLKLLRRAQASVDDLAREADRKQKLRDLVDRDLVERWLESARLRYLVTREGERWGLTDEGRKKTAPMHARALKIGAGTSGAAGTAAKFLGVAVLLKGAAGVVLGLPGIAFAANSLQFRSSREVVGLVASKEAVLGLREAMANSSTDPSSAN